MDIERAKQLIAEALLGKGMAKKAGDDLRVNPAYQRYVVDAQSKGVQALPVSDPNWQSHAVQVSN
jgi:hypothetical protein